MMTAATATAIDQRPTSSRNDQVNGVATPSADIGDTSSHLVPKTQHVPNGDDQREEQSDAGRVREAVPPLVEEVAEEPACERVACARRIEHVLERVGRREERRVLAVVEERAELAALHHQQLRAHLADRGGRAADVVVLAELARLLVVDDEPQIREVVNRYLEREGFKVTLAADGQAALAQFKTQGPDLVVLDLMLPKIDGLEVFRRLRAEKAIPIIMLTAKGEETDRIVGLELGADDYIVKPFSPRELVARVKTVLRRVSPTEPVAKAERPVVHGELRIDPRERTVSLGTKSLDLTGKEFDLLWFLATHPGQVFSRAQLLDRVWGYEFYGDSSTVTVHVRRLREKIEPDPSAPRYVSTVWGVGYKFEKE